MTEETEAQEAPVEEPKNYDEEYVRELRGEAANWRTKLRSTEEQVETLTNKLKEFEDSQKTELERLTEEKTKLEREKIDLERELTEEAVNAAIKVAASAANVVDVDAVVKMIDRYDISYTDGVVSGIDKALKKLLKDKPYLLREVENEIPAPGIGGPPIGSSGAKGLDGVFLEMMKGARKA